MSNVTIYGHIKILMFCIHVLNKCIGKQIFVQSNNKYCRTYANSVMKLYKK